MTLSGGQKQRLFIALALINDPEVVFLDELTTGLDPQARRAIWELVRGIRERGKTVFLTTHLMEEAERLCDRVAIIDHGRIVDIGTPAELVAPALPRAHGRPHAPTTARGRRAFRRDSAASTRSTRDGTALTIRGRGDDLVTRRDPVPGRAPHPRRRTSAPSCRRSRTCSSSSPATRSATEQDARCCAASGS